MKVLHSRFYVTSEEIEYLTYCKHYTYTSEVYIVLNN